MPGDVPSAKLTEGFRIFTTVHTAKPLHRRSAVPLPFQGRLARGSVNKYAVFIQEDIK